MIRACLPILASAVVLASCAPSLERQPVPIVPERTLVEAVPADASCRAIGVLLRQDAQPAPFTIAPEQLGFPVRITCEAAGYSATTETLHPRPQPSLVVALAEGLTMGTAAAPFASDGGGPRFGRVALGLSPTADIRPAAGAAEDSIVPFRIIVKLRRPFFETFAERDAFYEAIRMERAALWDTFRQRAEIGCLDPLLPQAGRSAITPPTICRLAYRQIDMQRARDLRQVEIDRRRATFR